MICRANWGMEVKNYDGTVGVQGEVEVLLWEI